VVRTQSCCSDLTASANLTWSVSFSTRSNKVRTSSGPTDSWLGWADTCKRTTAWLSRRSPNSWIWRMSSGTRFATSTQRRCGPNLTKILLLAESRSALFKDKAVTYYFAITLLTFNLSRFSVVFQSSNLQCVLFNYVYSVTQGSLSVITKRLSFNARDFCLKSLPIHSFLKYCVGLWIFRRTFRVFAEESE